MDPLIDASMPPDLTMADLPLAITDPLPPTLDTTLPAGGDIAVTTDQGPLDTSCVDPSVVGSGLQPGQVYCNSVNLNPAGTLCADGTVMDASGVCGGALSGFPSNGGGGSSTGAVGAGTGFLSGIGNFFGGLLRGTGVIGAQPVRATNATYRPATSGGLFGPAGTGFLGSGISMGLVLAGAFVVFLIVRKK